MWIIWLAIGCAMGWIIPQPTLKWKDSPDRVGLLKWVWLHIRDAAGMN